MSKVLEKLNGPYTRSPLEGVDISALTPEEQDRVYQAWRQELRDLGHSEEEIDEMRPRDSLGETSIELNATPDNF